MGLKDRIQHAWTAFIDDKMSSYDYGPSSWRPPYKNVNTFNSESFVSSIYNRIAIDVSMAKIRHVRVNPVNEDVKTLSTGLNECLNIEANIDQTSMQFMHDLVYSMFDEGVVAVVPVHTTVSPRITEGYDINSLRVGKVMEWFPKHVRVRLYNEDTGRDEYVTLSKTMVAIVENPLYAIMNSENSTLKRLITKISQLDNIDATAASGRLDLIIGIPYGIKSETQRTAAAARIEKIEADLSVGRHGVTYIDATEKITQLNRPVQDQLPETIDRLTKQFYNQLGLTQTIFDGTASEAELRIYYSRTIDPIIENIVAEFKRKFLTKTAITQGQDIQYYRDMFKFVTIEQLTAFGDAVRRNSILSSNEVRKTFGIRPSNDPRADELFNPNIADKNQNIAPSPQVGSLAPPGSEES